MPATSTETFESFKSIESNPNNLYTEYGVYDTVHNETPYSVCAFKDEDGNLFKQYYSHTKFSPQGARYKAERDYNQYLASCAEDSGYSLQVLDKVIDEEYSKFIEANGKRECTEDARELIVKGFKVSGMLNQESAKRIIKTAMGYGEFFYEVCNTKEVD